MNHLFLSVSFFSLICAMWQPATVYADNELLNSNSDTFFSTPLQNSDFLLITGVDYSSGSYGLEHNTDMLYIPFLLKYQKNNWAVHLTLSYIRMTGPGGVYGGGDGGVIPTRTDGTTGSGNANPPSPPPNSGKQPMIPHKKGKIRTHEGMGDALLNVTYALDIPLQLPFLFELGGQVKIPFADEKKELGTGEFDFYAYLDLAYTIGKFSPFVTLGYQFLGDPERINLDNVYYTSVGLDYGFSSKLHGGLIYDYKEKVFSDSYAKSEAMFYLNWSVQKDLLVNSYLVTGFSNGSPDWASGLQVSFSF